MAVGDYIAVVK